jgi:D-aminoacyl-tRNA deacylase
MRVLIQRVKAARVTIGGSEVASIGRGLLLFVGIGKGDTEGEASVLAKKISLLRVFEDGAGKMNLGIRESGGEVLSVSQFTLYADITRGNRPGFEQSADPETAKRLWEFFDRELRGAGLAVREGRFGEHMEVEIVNEGPVTLWLDSAVWG